MATIPPNISPNQNPYQSSTSIPNPSTKPFRFKSEAKSHSEKKRPKPSLDNDPTMNPPKRRRRHHHHHHHRHHHSSRPTKTNSPNSPPSPLSNTELDPDRAFRESLFDAMADDEGAAFWEGVYGQPINTYSPYYAKETGEGGGGDGNRVQDDENGLSRMTDEEYVSYVRSKMWEKSHGYILEERMKREEERKRRIEAEKVARRRDRDAYARIWNADDNTLRHNRKITRDSKGMDIRESTSWKISWQNYLKAWDRLREEMDGKHHNNNDNNDNKNNNNDPTTPTSQPQSQKPTPIPIPIQHLIPWPVKTQNIKDVNQGSIEEFLKNAPLTHIPLTNANVPLSKSVPSESKSEKQDAENLNLTSLLKSERIRWHPDKIQQRYGMYGYGIDGETMSVVTGVFQVLDRMLGERR